MPNIYLPTFRCVLSPPRTVARVPNQMVFSVPRYLNKLDIRGYLESMYSIPIKKVNTTVLSRSGQPHPRPELFNAHPARQPFMWNTVYKLAFVEVESANGMKVEYPGFPSNAVEMHDNKENKIKDKQVNARQHANKYYDKEWEKTVMARFPDGSDQKIEIPAVADTLLEHRIADTDSRVKGQAKVRLGLKKQYRASIRQGKEQMLADTAAKQNLNSK